MYQNRATLIGFLGKDAEARTTKTNQTPYTVLRLATKTSWKDRESGEWQSRTEWHRCLVWGRLGEFAATLTRGAHVQVEGELRSRTYAEVVGEGKKKTRVEHRIWEVRVESILKLDRAERHDPATDEPAEAVADTPEVPF